MINQIVLDMVHHSILLLKHFSLFLQNGWLYFWDGLYILLLILLSCFSMFNNIILSLEITYLIFYWKKFFCVLLAPVLDTCLQTWTTEVLGPVWVSKGEGFSPKGVKEFLKGMIAYTKSKLNEARHYQEQVDIIIERKSISFHSFIVILGQFFIFFFF